MSLNLGNEAIGACLNLANNGDFAMFRASLMEKVREQMNAALDCEAGKRDDAIGYARALRDLWLAIDAAATNKRIQNLPKPSPVAAALGR